MNSVFRAPPPPNLKTLNRKPSWHNRAGRVDRSACAEIRASNVWSYIIASEPLRPRSGRAPNVECAVTAAQRHPNSEIDRRGDAAARTKRFAFHLTARYLAHLQNKFPGYTLTGDERTTKSNAMRPRNINSKHLRFPDVCNPNKGAAREKFLGLWHSWSQDITIIRKYQHKRLSQHFLQCPGCGKRALKMFIPMCTREEAQDADAAELWVSSIDDYYQSFRRPTPAETMQLRGELINRYGLLFRDGRVLKCRKCYGVRYGEKKQRAAASPQRSMQELRTAPTTQTDQSQSPRRPRRGRRGSLHTVVVR